MYNWFARRQVSRTHQRFLIREWYHSVMCNIACFFSVYGGWFSYLFQKKSSNHLCTISKLNYSNSTLSVSITFATWLESDIIGQFFHKISNILKTSFLWIFTVIYCTGLICITLIHYFNTLLHLHYFINSEILSGSSWIPLWFYERLFFPNSQKNQSNQEYFNKYYQYLQTVDIDLLSLLLGIYLYSTSLSWQFQHQFGFYWSNILLTKYLIVVILTDRLRSVQYNQYIHTVNFWNQCIIILWLNFYRIYLWISLSVKSVWFGSMDFVISFILTMFSKCFDICFFSVQ